MTSCRLRLKNHEPKGHINVQAAGAIKRLDDLLKQYPNHADLKKMHDHAADIHSKIDPKASRSAPFTPDTPWEDRLRQLWVNMHHAQFAHAQGDDKTAAGLLSNIRQNQEILLKPDRMKDYPPELKKWVTDSQAQYDQLAKDVKHKR